MKKLVLVLFILIATTLVFADAITATFDFGIIQDLVVKTQSLQLSTDCRYQVRNKYEFRIPITLSLTNGAQLLDCGLFLSYYPWQNHGLFFGLSLFEFGFVRGETTLDKKYYALNEINFGWTFKLYKGLILEPSLVIRDPSGTYSDEYDMIRGAFACNRSFRFRLSAGWRFDVNN